VAHVAYLHTFNSQKSLSEEERAYFVQPTIEISEGVAIRWGRYMLDVFYNPGKTLSSLNVDIPEADLLIIGDEIVGNTVFVSSAGVPEMFFRAISRLQSRGRSRVIPGHMGVFREQSLKNAKSYLSSLQAQVEAARRAPDAENSILNISIESCMAPQVEASDFEREYHQINLRLIIERELFIPYA
jgi:glyoxylase-like metal-dependent hydrolase (beta-lactamase superfamily II)